MDSFKIVNLKDVDKSLNIEVDYHIPEYVDLEGNMVYLNVPLINYMDKNPFESPNRTYPVEFPYKGSDQEEIDLILPRGYQINEFPPPRVLRRQKLNFGYVFKSSESIL